MPNLNQNLLKIIRVKTMAHVKLNADDIILTHRQVRDATYYKVYTLVCRADINKPNSWNLSPSTDLAVIGNNWAECELYIQGIKDVQRFQELKYPDVKVIRQSLASEITKFHDLINSMYYEPKTK